MKKVLLAVFFSFTCSASCIMWNNKDVQLV